ncbi:hypothetical protein [Parabacteroides distasonis]|jgi:hypothetical protein|uniref:hypothetical protein n=1 Tax=Parabacteroides distasonis TaxID=823 RepID=UPI001E3EDA72|nr:hypothetical protein [Parabacteroides distasonis]UVQ90584.1 hypothetical protein NXX59_12390 [Parabacteroides distasonis]UVR76538.1 hypothetical protein NXV66_12535 [Parabacteroides distasonis]
MGEPNTPLFFRRWDACHSKQQAGHGKITVGFGQNTKVLSLSIGELDRFHVHSLGKKEDSFKSYNLNIVLLHNASGELQVLQALQGVTTLRQVLLSIQKQSTAEYPYFSYWLSSNHFP